MQCSKVNTHSSKCMILLECLHDQLRSRVLTDSLSHSPKPCMRIVILLVGNPPMNIYQLGHSDDSYILFVCGLPSDEYISSGPLRRLIYYLVWTTFRSFYIIRQPSEPFSLDLSHALTPKILGCPSAYGMHVCQFQYSLNHMQIYIHEYIYIKIISYNML